jgi:hypothetical protein
VAKKIKTLSASATGAPVTAATTLMLNADAYRCGVTGAVLENIPLRGVVDRQSQTALCPSRRVSCALDGAISRARVQKIAAKGCTRMEVRVSYVEKRRILQRTATCARKMVSLISQPLAFSGNMCLLSLRPTNVQSADGSTAASFLGTGREAGADEDDFHMIRRRNKEIDGDEREEAKALRAGALAGVVKASGGTSFKPKKVVYF